MRQSEYADLKKRLLVFYTDEEADKWMTSPHPLLEGRRAVDCYWNQVSRVIGLLEDGAFI